MRVLVITFALLLALSAFAGQTAKEKVNSFEAKYDQVKGTVVTERGKELLADLDARIKTYSDHADKAGARRTVSDEKSILILFQRIDDAEAGIDRSVKTYK
jgi:hypothetical protein